RSGKMFRPVPYPLPRWWSYDLDGDGIYETPTMMAEQASTNLIPNSFAGTNLTGWVADGSVSLSRVTSMVDGLASLFGAAGLIGPSANNAGVSIYQSG